MGTNRGWLVVVVVALVAVVALMLWLQRARDTAPDDAARTAPAAVAPATPEDDPGEARPDAALLLEPPAPLPQGTPEGLYDDLGEANRRSRERPAEALDIEPVVPPITPPEPQPDPR